MDFIEHTLNWTRGEIFEGTIIFFSGLATILIAVLFVQYGTTPAAKALFIPLLVVGILFSIAGGYMYISNKNRVIKYQQAYEMNPTDFIQKEKKRVEDFQYMYPLSTAISSAAFILTLLLFWFTNSKTWQAIGVALMIFGAALLIIDYFSKERSAIYYQEILEEMR